MMKAIFLGLIGLLFVTVANAEDWALVKSYVEDSPYTAQDGKPAIILKYKNDLYVAPNSVRKSGSQINASYLTNSTFLGPMAVAKNPFAKNSYLTNADFDCRRGAVRTWMVKHFNSDFAKGPVDLEHLAFWSKYASNDWERVTPGDDAYEVLNFLCR